MSLLYTCSPTSEDTFAVDSRVVTYSEEASTVAISERSTELLQNVAFGTVRYIGKISGTTGDWVGVQWDTKRGKHDGTYNGTSYFACENGFGSFVRKEKIRPVFTLPETILKRYWACEVSKEELKELYVYTTSQQIKPIELIGSNEVSDMYKKNIAQLTRLDVGGMGIEQINANEVAKLCPTATEMVLRGNLIHSWREVFNLPKQLPSLELLDLSLNPLLLFDSEISQAKDDLPYAISESICTLLSESNLKFLYLNDLSMSWETVYSLSPYMGKIEELHLCNNKITQISCDHLSEWMKSLRILNLDGCKIDSWDEVWKLRQLPKLESLLLSQNNISKIYYHSTKEEIPFASLNTISLVGNKISSWSDIDVLNEFPQLTSFRIQNNPLTCHISEEASWSALTARTLPNITRINGSIVKPNDRADNKKYFLRLWIFEKNGLNVPSTSPLALAVMAIPPEKFIDNLRKEEPEMTALIEEQVLALRNEKTALASSSSRSVLANALLTLRIECHAVSGHIGDTVVNVPPSMRLSMLKKLIQQKFQVPAQNQMLFYRATSSNFPSPLTQDESLGYYGLMSGGTITVEE